MYSVIIKRNEFDSLMKILVVVVAFDFIYRNERFKKEEHYEWFKDYSHFRHLIQAHINPNSSVNPLTFSIHTCLFLCL